ncbi:FAD dependent oxidoreductase [Emticicia oligotrophica DSM 17448]|uniref:FAD dependent oxidoreductase n=1 Tax=Emticicia oligotrophica (strain DSM 17448 / CIP 109782 / MTCC 6937 / GPTSA100-15) TaxID=929562 RepID=A0ABM5N5B2_EMTOG|nr:oleate hydratase [Emticicia oligotrophica]AFK04600.1 FAD dependent oxidoreductase [Emticicia oligotrophica DSM 17448]
MKAIIENTENSLIGHSEKSTRDITIIGSGVIGLFSAYYLSKKGYEVTIIERTNGDDSCSMGNAGMIVPSHFIPLAVPGMIEKGIRWMFNAESPFYVKPRLSVDLISWGLKFYQAANKKQVERAMPALRDISLLSKALYQDLSKDAAFNFAFEEKGLMMLCKTEHSFEEEVEVAHQAKELGLETKILSVAELHKLEPEVKPDVAGAILYTGDAHLYPNQLVKNLKSYLINKGVKFLYNTEVTGFEFEKKEINKIKVKQIAGNSTKNLELKTQNLVIATGSWSPNLAEMLNIGLPMQAGKGYSVTYQQNEGQKLNIPSILLEARVAITPMSDNLIRFGGTMEIGGINDEINMNRVRGIIKAVPNFFPNYDIKMPEKEQVWYGLRPCSPDGLPYIGRTNSYKNLIIASGHAMMGLSLAPATGKLVQEIIDNEKNSIDISLYNPERYD